MRSAAVAPCWLLVAVPVAAQATVPATFGAAAAIVESTCLDCHDRDRHKGGLDLGAAAVAALPTVDRLWLLRSVRNRVAAGEMPPPDAEPLTAADRATLVRCCADTLAVEVPQLPPVPGHVTIRRLSRAEWEYTVQDLFGVRTELAAAFPVDDLGYGFDNIGAALSFSTLHLEKYLAAAADVAAQVFPDEDPARPAVRRSEAELMQVVDGPGVAQDGEVAGLWTNATLATSAVLPRDGDYRLRVMVGADQAGDEPAKMRVAIDGNEVSTIEVSERQLRAVELPATLGRGPHRIELAFVNDYWEPKHPDPERRDRNLRIDWLEVEGPIDAPTRPAQQRWIGAVDGRRLGRLAQQLAQRVWRRQVTGPDVRHVVAVGRRTQQAGGSDRAAAAAMLTALLASPRFLFRGEPRAGGSRARGADATAVDDAALGVRLSYFVWSSAPDDTLLQLARQQRLGDDEVLRQQLRRMLADPRAERLATNFAAQWLELRALDERTPDPALFPGFDAALRRSMRRESELLFLDVLRQDRPVQALLDTDATFVDATLAAFYGIDGGFGAEFTRVPLPPLLRERGGVLGHASVQAVTSNPTRTSPVKRGKWILENLLGMAPPAPPPGNDSFADEAATHTPRGLREQLAAHRERAVCASCHARMDALGLALERYDAIGRPREQVLGVPVDATATLPDGRAIDGLRALKAALLPDPAFPRTLAAKLFVYGVGREPARVDRLQLDAAVDRLAAAGPVTIAQLIEAVVLSPAFRRTEVER